MPCAKSIVVHGYSLSIISNVVPSPVISTNVTLLMFQCKLGCGFWWPAMQEVQASAEHVQGLLFVGLQRKNLQHVVRAGAERIQGLLSVGLQCKRDCMLLCRQALSVYKGRSWQFIEEHVHDNLGRTFKEMGDLQSAVHHFMAVLPCPQATTALQGRYLQQFLDAVHQAGAAEVNTVALIAAVWQETVCVCILFRPLCCDKVVSNGTKGAVVPAQYLVFMRFMN